MYRLERHALGLARRITITDDRHDIERDHVRAISRELDSLINQHRREIHLIASNFYSSISDNLSGEPLVTFQIIGEPIFEGDLDDTDTLDVSALRSRLNDKGE